MTTDDPLRRLVHDARTPVTLIRGFADLLVKRPDLEPEQQAEFAQRILDAADDLNGILDRAGR